METKSYLKEIRSLISQDRLDEAFGQLRKLFAHSPQLNQVLLQSARYADITRHVNQGTISYADSQPTLNQIRSALLNLTSEVENQLTEPAIQREVSEAISVMDSKNVLIGTTISAGGNVRIGDDTTIHTESTSSRRIRLWLFILVPLLSVLGAFFWYQFVFLTQPLSLKVLIESVDSQPELPDPMGKLTLTYGGKPETKAEVATEALFEQLPAHLRDEMLRLRYQAKGFVPIDTSFRYTEAITLPVRRNDELALLEGYVYRDGSEPLEGIAGVKVSIACCTTETDATGKFSLPIPVEHQRKKQRLEFFHPAYHAKSTTEPVMKGELIRTYLSLK